MQSFRTNLIPCKKESIGDYALVISLSNQIERRVVKQLFFTKKFAKLDINYVFLYYLFINKYNKT